MKKSPSLPRLSVLSVALLAALSTMSPITAMAEEHILQPDRTDTFSWQSGDLTVAKDVDLTLAAPVVLVPRLALDPAAVPTDPVTPGAPVTVGTFINHGKLTSSGNEVVSVSGAVTAMQNDGTIAGAGDHAVFNDGVIGEILNEGMISGGKTGITNALAGQIGAVRNEAGGVVTGNLDSAIRNDKDAKILAIQNEGTISGNQGISNAGKVRDVTLALPDRQEAVRANAQLSPTAQVAATTQAAAAPTTQMLNITSARLDSQRAPAQGGAAKGVATGEQGRDVLLWGQAFNGNSTQGQRGDLSGYHARYNGLLIGADAPLNDNLRVGGLISYADTKVNNDGDNAGSSSKIGSYGLFGYAGYVGDPWFIDVSAGVINQRYKSKRAIDFTGFAGNAEAAYSGTQYVASVQAGLPIDLGAVVSGMTLTPIAGLTYSTLRQDGYTEDGGNGAALTVGSSAVQSFKSDLGMKLSRAFDTRHGTVSPFAQMTWRHEYQNARVQSIANYAADTTGASSFTSEGAAPTVDTGLLSLGVTLLNNRNMTLSARYTLESATAFRSHTGDIRMQYQF